MKHYNKIDFKRTAEEQAIVEEWIKEYNKTLENYDSYDDLWDTRWNTFQKIESERIEQLEKAGFRYFAEEYSCERVPVGIKKDNKVLYGYVDLDGETIIEPKYSEVKNYIHGYAWVSEDEVNVNYICAIPGNWGLIDKDGHMLIQPQYRYTSTYAPNYHRVSNISKGKKYIRYGIVDDHNNVILPMILYWDGICSGTVVRQCVAGSYAEDDYNDEFGYGILDIVTGEWRLAPVGKKDILDNWDNLDVFEIEGVGYYNVVTRTLRYYEHAYNDVKDYIECTESELNIEVIRDCEN